MRRAHSNVNWLLGKDEGLVGISLGFDHCGQHEWGIAGILSALAVELPALPLGVQDRAIRRMPSQLTLTEYTHKPRDKRRKGYPAAFLLLEPAHWNWAHRDDAPQGADKLKSTDCSFYGEPNDKHWRENDDLATSWNCEGFCIHVRGTKNIARLKELHAAFSTLDIAVAVPWAHAFLRGGLSFTIPSRMPQADKDAVYAQDAAFKKLCEAAQATGIEAELEKAGIRAALRPDWFDREVQDEVVFFVNPSDQRKYDYGWFTVEELRLATTGQGPMMKYTQLDEFKKQPQNYDWACRLLRGLEKQGLRLRYGAQVTWADEAKTVPGLRVRMSKASKGLIADGTYPFDEFMSRYAEPLAQAEPAAA